MIRIDKRGQTALETAFVVLFIIMAVWAISSRAIRYNSEISQMSRVRVEAQGIALALSARGTTTHLIRIDEADHKADLYVVSENCTEAQTAFSARISNLINQWNCQQCLYSGLEPCTQ